MDLKQCQKCKVNFRGEGPLCYICDREFKKLNPPDVSLKTQPNEHRCHSTKQRHILPLKPCCPMSGNPRPGSEISIEYKINEKILEVASLREYVDSYIGGKDDVRSMEGMIQRIAQDCANAVQTSVWVKASLIIEPEQRMEIECSAYVTGSAPTLTRKWK